jgi:hypothetical protein
MARERSQLEERREQLTQSLSALSETKASSYRVNSDAIALDRAGVKHGRPEELVRLGEAAVAADTAMRDAHRELRDIYSEIDRLPRGGLGARLGRAARRRPADR